MSKQTRRPKPPVEHRGRVTVRATPQTPAPSATAGLAAKAENAAKRGRVRDLLGRAHILAETGEG